jgi:hypothetical protein
MAKAKNKAAKKTTARAAAKKRKPAATGELKKGEQCKKRAAYLVIIGDKKIAACYLHVKIIMAKNADKKPELESLKASGKKTECEYKG